MRSFHWLAALAVIGCGGHGEGFDAGNGDSGDDGALFDAGCPLCGIDSSPSDGAFVCTPNPANFDIPGNGCDDDGDGIIDNPPGMCDTGLPTASPTAKQFSQAIGICPGKGDTWGVMTATYTQGVGSTAVPMTQQYGTDATFGTGVKARQGAVLGILSSGVAAPQDCGGGQFKGNICSTTGPGAPPPNYPKTALVGGVGPGTCPISNIANDVVDVVLKIQVPANAKGFTYDFNFYSGEWPEWVCTTFNDTYVAWLTSSAWKGNAGDFNISFDPKKNPVSVNNQFFQACSPKNAIVGCSGTSSPPADTCTLGDGELQGTGFFIAADSTCGQTDSGGGATGWLTTQAPVTPGEIITLQFMVWNTGDEAYDSSVLLDNWNWVATDTSVGTIRPPN